MIITTYIENLLYDHDCVIVPGLGGFIANDRPAGYNSFTNQFRPPFKKLIFNPHIRFNDGLLVNYIVRNESVSFEQARKQVEDYAAQILSKLEENEKVQLKHIGTLLFDQNKNFVFDQDLSVNYLAESFGLESIVSPLIRRETPDKVPEGIVEKRETSVLHHDRKPTVVTEDMKPRHERKSRNKMWIFRDVSLVLILFFSLSGIIVWFFSEFENTFNDWQALTAVYFNESKQVRYAPRIVNIPETGKAGFLTESFQENEQETDQSASLVSEPEAVEVIEAEKNEVEFVEPEVNQNAIVDVQPVSINNTTSSGPYYLIAGAFASKANADLLIEQLIQKGFPAHIIDTNQNGLYRVAYLGMSNFAEAKQQLLAIRKDENPEAWILKK